MHEGHRSRMREKYLKNGEDAFLNHELLETILFYAVPRCNTNEIAHELIEKFGSIRGVADADYYALQTIRGIGENAAVLLKLLGTFSRRYFQDASKDTLRFDKLSLAREFGVSMLRGYPSEQFCALLLDNQLRKVDFIPLTKGTVNHVPINLAEFYRHCLERPVSAVVLYHNHPNGLAVPSREDVNLTYQLESKLTDINVYLLEHFVVSDHSCMPILYAQGASFKSSLAGGDIERERLENFYCN